MNQAVQIHGVRRRYWQAAPEYMPLTAVCPARDPFTADRRFHHPENGIFTQNVFHLCVQAGLDDHAAVTLIQHDTFNHTDIHAAAFDFGFTGFDPFRVISDQGDFRSLSAKVADKDPAPISTVTMGIIQTGDQLFSLLTFASVKSSVLSFNLRLLSTLRPFFQADPTSGAGRTFRRQSLSE